LQQNRSSQNAQAHQQANQVNGQTPETVAEHSASDTGQHHIITGTAASQCLPHHQQQQYSL